MKDAQKIAFGERLRQARKDAELTQSQLGEHLGVIKQSVSFWEKGDWMPRADQLTRIARRLNVTSDWLLTGMSVPASGSSGRLRYPGLMVARLTMAELVAYAKGDLQLAQVKDRRLSHASGDPENFFSFDVIGLGMVGTSGEGIIPGSMVTVDITKKPAPGEIVAVAVLGGSEEVLLGRWRPTGSKPSEFKLKFDNPDFGERVLTRKDKARNIGTMVEHVALRSR